MAVTRWEWVLGREENKGLVFELEIKQLSLGRILEKSVHTCRPISTCRLHTISCPGLTLDLYLHHYWQCPWSPPHPVTVLFWNLHEIVSACRTVKNISRHQESQDSVYVKSTYRFIVLS
jgi:hypothetical protein